MAVTPSQAAIARLSRMVAASITPVLDESALADALSMYATADSNKVAPGGTGWLETYDYNGAAYECWSWKEAAATNMVGFNADGTQWNMQELLVNIRAKKAEHLAARQTGNIHVSPHHHHHWFTDNPYSVTSDTWIPE
jgi:hypothetical protein